MKKKHWFREQGWIYVPNNKNGYILTLSILIFNILAFIIINHSSRSINETLYDMFPYFVPSFGMLLWIASESSKNRK
jgi:hypothetical protein